MQPYSQTNALNHFNILAAFLISDKYYREYLLSDFDIYATTDIYRMIKSKGVTSTDYRNIVSIAYDNHRRTVYLAQAYRKFRLASTTTEISRLVILLFTKSDAIKRH